MLVGVCRVSLLAPQCHSLKEKRSVVRKVKDRIRARFHISLSEVGAQNTWQRAVLGFAVVGSSRNVVEAQLGDVVAAIDAMGLAQVIADDREVIVYGDGDMGHGSVGAAGQGGAAYGAAHGDRTGQDSWVPSAWLSDDDSDNDAGGKP